MLQLSIGNVFPVFGDMVHTYIYAQLDHVQTEFMNTLGYCVSAEGGQFENFV